jgi:hypothetical protein
MAQRDETEKGLAALLVHAMYAGASYPMELQNIEEGRVKAKDPETLKQYEELAQAYDRELLKLHQEMARALMDREKSADEILVELMKRQGQLSLGFLERELDLSLEWSEEAKEEVRQGLTHLQAELSEMSPEEDPDAYEGLQKLIQLLEEMLRRR